MTITYHHYVRIAHPDIAFEVYEASSSPNSASSGQVVATFKYEHDANLFVAAKKNFDPPTSAIAKAEESK